MKKTVSISTFALATLLSRMIVSSTALGSSAAAPLAPLLTHLGDHHVPVTTRSAHAQRFFDQGMRLVYGFNHAEAIRAFKETTRLDPRCAMAHWGVSLALGPNINAPMNRASEQRAVEAIEQAGSLATYATARERDLIGALALRYSKAEGADRGRYDRAYADAMRKLSRKYPADLDIATLFAESLLDLSPWDYWRPDSQPYPNGREAVAVLESVLKRNPDHPGAIHYYIHAVEASSTPQRAERFADRLGKIIPGSGHLVHMPAHIYVRVGRYDDAVTANVIAAAVDERYIAECRAQGLYPLAYYPHNVHFLSWSASFAGRSGAALEAARKLAAKVHNNELPDPDSCGCCPRVLGQQEDKAALKELGQALYGPYQYFEVMPLFTLVRFGKWQEILNEPKPAANRDYAVGIWHYARGRALNAMKRQSEAMAELEQLEAARDRAASKKLLLNANPASAVLAVAREVLTGEIAASPRRYDEAISHLERAVRLEDAMMYTEPQDWPFPARESLGAILLEAGRPAEAETVYWADQRKNPGNPWTLFGLMKSLQSQGKTEQAAAVEERFRRAWRNADVTLTGSRL